jgi:hypothetical protein
MGMKSSWPAVARYCELIFPDQSNSVFRYVWRCRSILIPSTGFAGWRLQHWIWNLHREGSAGASLSQHIFTSVLNDHKGVDALNLASSLVCLKPSDGNWILGIVLLECGRGNWSLSVVSSAIKLMLSHLFIHLFPSGSCFKLVMPCATRIVLC